MNVPAIAKKTFEELRREAQYLKIFNFVTEALKSITSSLIRAELVHKIVDELNQETFAHPLVKEMSPCKKGCSACCHTQVSVTDDEADLLAQRILDGQLIDMDRLKIQFAARNDGTAYFNIKYDDRKCIFLDDQGACQVYEDRPSVCRTNVVLGNADQCDTSKKIQNTRLVKTPKADMAIVASFLYARSSGTLPYMIGKKLGLKD